MRAFLNSFLICLMSVIFTPFQMAASLAGSSLARKIPLLYHRVACRLIGINITVIGSRAATNSVLYACNHVSWLDITVLGRLIDGSFVAKSEVASWPGFGHLARLQRTVFINRSRRADTRKSTSELERRLRQGDNLILFPEGTSSNGQNVLPFKTALFGVAEQAASNIAANQEGKKKSLDLIVQPVTISYTAINNIPLVRARRPWVAWYGDMELLPHFWRIMGMGGLSVEVRFHAPARASDFESRKALAQYCHEQVVAGNRVAGTPKLVASGALPPPHDAARIDSQPVGANLPSFTGKDGQPAGLAAERQR